MTITGALALERRGQSRDPLVQVTPRRQSCLETSLKSTENPSLGIYSGNPRTGSQCNSGNSRTVLTATGDPQSEAGVIFILFKDRTLYRVSIRFISQDVCSL